jgi:hypothetical protein
MEDDLGLKFNKYRPPRAVGFGPGIIITQEATKGRSKLD